MFLFTKILLIFECKIAPLNHENYKIFRVCPKSFLFSPKFDKFPLKKSVHKIDVFIL